MTDHKQEFELVVGFGIDMTQWERRDNGSWVHRSAIVANNAIVGEGVIVGERVRVGARAIVGEPDAITSIQKLGSRRTPLTAILYPDKIMVGTGCFWGTLEELETKVAEVHAGTRWADDYGAAFVYLRSWGEITRKALGPALAEGIARLEAEAREKR